MKVVRWPGFRRIQDEYMYKGLERCRWWEGRVYFEPDMLVTVVAPIPLNFLLSWFRRVWLRLRAGRWEQETLWVYNLGYKRGLRAWGENRERREQEAQLNEIVAELKEKREQLKRNA